MSLYPEPDLDNANVGNKERSNPRSAIGMARFSCAPSGAGGDLFSACRAERKEKC